MCHAIIWFNVQPLSCSLAYGNRRMLPIIAWVSSGVVTGGSACLLEGLGDNHGNGPMVVLHGAAIEQRSGLPGLACLAPSAGRSCYDSPQE